LNDIFNDLGKGKIKWRLGGKKIDNDGIYKRKFNPSAPGSLVVKKETRETP